MPRQCFSRRTLLKVVAVTAAPIVLPAEIFGKNGKTTPSNKITFGVIGVGKRGRDDLRHMLRLHDAQLLALCDVQAERRNAAQHRVAKDFGGQTDLYGDFRDMLDRKDIDAVLVAAGDHWHAHLSIYAAQAGKDVYAETPCAITFDLCRQLAASMKQYGTIFQGGTQRRSSGNFKRAVDLARSGKLGKLKEVHAAIDPLSVRYDWLPPQPLPNREEIDWDLWLGPAPWRPYNVEYIKGEWRTRCDFDFWTKRYGWNIDTVDLCQWAVNADGTTPITYWTEGHRLFGMYKNGVKLVMRPDGWKGLGRCSIRFEGEHGWIETDDSGRIVVSPDSLRRELIVDPNMNGDDHDESLFAHVRNFFDCVKTREQPLCHAEAIASTHRACHASAISRLLQRELTFDSETDAFMDEQANQLRTRVWREPWTIPVS